jgi:hypothetical protein
MYKEENRGKCKREKKGIDDGKIEIQRIAKMNP